MGRNPSRVSLHAFTLLELLVVIGVIAVIAGIGVAAFSGRNPGASLSNAQAISISLLNSARARALATGYPARLLLAADDTNAPDDYLRRLYVAYQEVTGVNATTGAVTLEWRLTDNGTPLDQGIYAIPPNLAATQLDSTVTLADFTSANLKSVTSGGSAVFSQNFGNEIKSKIFYYFEINAQGGGFSPTIAYRLVFANAQVAPPGSTPPGPRFDNTNFVRGFRLSTYGVPSIVNDAASFQ